MLGVPSAPLRFARVHDAQFLPLPSFDGEAGTLVVMEGNGTVPICIARAFTVRARAGSKRGAHAHRRCTQVMVCVSGRCKVTIDDAASRRTELLSEQRPQALLVPPTLWAEQVYLDDRTVLLVLCDRPYEPEDYVRDYGTFAAWRAQAGNLA